MNRRKQSTILGVTLIELMVVIVVLAIVATIAAPALQNFIRDNRVTAQSNELSALVALARSQSTSSLSGYEIRFFSVGNGWSAEVHNLACSPSCMEKALTFTNTALTVEDDTLPPTLTFNDRAVLSSGEVTFALQHVPCAGQRQRAILDVLISGSVRTNFSGCL